MDVTANITVKCCKIENHENLLCRTCFNETDLDDIVYCQTCGRSAVDARHVGHETSQWVLDKADAEEMEGVWCNHCERSPSSTWYMLGTFANHKTGFGNAVEAINHLHTSFVIFQRPKYPTNTNDSPRFEIDSRPVEADRRSSTRASKHCPIFELEGSHYPAAAEAVAAATISTINRRSLDAPIPVDAFLQLTPSEPQLFSVRYSPIDRASQNVPRRKPVGWSNPLLKDTENPAGGNTICQSPPISPQNVPIPTSPIHQSPTLNHHQKSPSNMVTPLSTYSEPGMSFSQPAIASHRPVCEPIPSPPPPSNIPATRHQSVPLLNVPYELTDMPPAPPQPQPPQHSQTVPLFLHNYNPANYPPPPPLPPRSPVSPISSPPLPGTSPRPVSPMTTARFPPPPPTYFAAPPQLPPRKQSAPARTSFLSSTSTSTVQKSLHKVKSNKYLSKYATKAMGVGIAGGILGGLLGADLGDLGMSDMGLGDAGAGPGTDAVAPTSSLEANAAYHAQAEAGQTHAVYDLIDSSIIGTTGPGGVSGGSPALQLI